jgi:hypothetical protein
MSTLALRPSSPVAVRDRALGVARSPLPVWVALFANVLAFADLPTLLHVPGIVGQLVTQGALVAALLLVLFANPYGVVRPNTLLLLLTLLAVVALMVSIHNEFIYGSTYRACRLLVFVLVLWGLTPWWGRSDLALLRCQVTCLRFIVATVVVGAVIAPGAAFSYDGRLSGALWPIPPTQVAHYSAVLVGATVVLWFGGVVRGRTALVTLLVAGTILMLTHTRTALLAMVIGLALAGASMFLGHARVRRASAFLGVIAVVGATFFSPFIVGWLSRGQSVEEASRLTGRTSVWTSISGLQRPWLEEAFGTGLSNKSFNGLPIDSNWLAVYLDQGWFGVIIDAALLLTLLLWAAIHQRGLRRALALFLTTYCLVASITETGLGDASPYLLELIVAASLLAAPAERQPAMIRFVHDDGNDSTHRQGTT